MGTRRKFLQSIGLSAAGIIPGSDISAYELKSNSENERSTVSLIGGVSVEGRRRGVYEALEPFRDSIEQAIQGKQVILKPNVVQKNVPNAVVNVDTIRGVLDFLSPLTNRTIIIGEASSTPPAVIGLGPGTWPDSWNTRILDYENDTLANFSHYGYNALLDEYDVELIDFNKEPSTTVHWIADFNNPGNRLPLNIANRFLDSDNYFFSIANMKNHSSAVCTLTIKNFMMGAPLSWLVSYPEDYEPKFITKWIGSEKTKMHMGSYKGLNYNIVRVARHIHPQFAILDGTIGLEGEGPTLLGTPIAHGVIVAGPDFVSVDRVGVELMGLDINMVKHVQYCGLAGVGQAKLDNIDIIGGKIDELRKIYKKSSSYADSTKYIENEPSIVTEFQESVIIDNGELSPKPIVDVSNYPNPFNVTTNIRIVLESDAELTLFIYNMNGQKVRELLGVPFRAGSYLVRWNGKDNEGSIVASGIYTVVAKAGIKTATHQMTFVK